jgi:ribosome-associated translation inhibitor RaiA
MNLRIAAKSVTLSDAVRHRIALRLHHALARYSAEVTSVDLTLEDENGPRGGVDKRCRIVVKVRAGKEVVVEGRSDRAWPLIDRTADRAGRAVARAVDMRRRRSTSRASGDLGARRA